MCALDSATTAKAIVTEQGTPGETIRKEATAQRRKMLQVAVI
jgi:hypothetical protein